MLGTEGDITRNLNTRNEILSMMAGAGEGEGFSSVATTNDLTARIKKGLRGLKKVAYLSLADREWEHYNGIRLCFRKVNFKAPQVMGLVISIPEELLGLSTPVSGEEVFYEDFLLRSITPKMREYADSLINANQEVNKRGEIYLQSFDSRVARRSGMLYEDGFYRFRILVRLPLQGLEFTEPKSCIRLLKGILQTVTEWAEHQSLDGFNDGLTLYREQQEIRRFLSENGYSCFVGNGSIITRDEAGNGPLKEAIPFLSPAADQITIPLSGGHRVTGMAIRNHTVTVITGGGYSGKSTLLDGIESGIYDHIRGDGREYILTDRTALKTYAEDGRPVNRLNLSPFFRDNFLDQHIEEFYTDYASGSVSQAANIVEALYAGSRLLLVDEDKSATNFLLKDALMRKINPNDPIIPFTDRIRELTDTKGCSVIMVVGAVSAYFAYADTILLAEKFTFSDVTGIVPKEQAERSRSVWCEKRYCVRDGNPMDMMFRTVNTENAQMIYVGRNSADVLALSAIISNDQLNSLAYAMERLLSRGETFEIAEAASEIVSELLKEDLRPATSFDRMTASVHRFFEEVRPIDIVCALSRMRGVEILGLKE